MAGPPKLFNLKHSLLNEMSNLQALMKSDPDKGKEILLLGEALIQHANQGLLRKFIAAATELSRSEGPLLYFLTKGLIDALKRGHLMIASFVLDNGFNLHDPHLPHVLNTVLKDDVVTDNVALIAVQLLQRYQYDFNLQVSALALLLLFAWMTTSWRRCRSERRTGRRCTTRCSGRSSARSNTSSPSVPT